MNERDIFLAAIEITDPSQRAAFVENACGTDAALLSQVEALLKTHAQTSQFLETPAAANDSVAQTIVTKSGAPDDDSSERASGESEFRKYLQPATRPGWLGRLGHYEIETILGRGAFGIVAKAFDEKLHRVVAIKLMNPELAATSPPRQRFLREARTAAAVTHENIVAIHAVEEEPIPYLVMEYIPGQTLQQRMDAKGPFEAQEILRIGQQVAAGLAAANGANLIHRDIKPSNILLTGGPAERAKISDFGLARAVDDATMTSSGLIAGTPMYMAPEQARGETLDHRADLFSLGSVLYQMASGRPPFRAANTVAVLKRVCEDTPRPLDDVLPGIPGWLETVILKLLEKKRDDRYQTAQELADLLARCQRELEHNGQVTCVKGSPRAAETQDFPPARSTDRGAKRKPIGWLIGGVLAVAAVIGFVLMNGGKKLPDQDTTSPTADDLASRGPSAAGTSKSSVSQPADKSVFDLNRETAKWAHGRGATLVIAPGIVVQPADELPNTPFIVVQSFFREGANVTNLELDPLKRVRHLRAFGLASPRPPEGLFDVLQEQPRLYQLEIESAGMRTSELARSKSWDTLLSLQILATSQNLDDEWRFLERCPSLQRLIVGGTEQLPKLLNRLSDVPNLRNLDLLHATTVDEQAVAMLQVKNPHLRVTVGKWAGSRVVGRDPVRDAIQALLRQNAKVFGINYGRGVPEEITPDNLNDATPWGVAEIHLEAITRCTEENQQHLASLESGQYLTLIANHNVDADEWARAISRRRLVHNFFATGDGLTDAGLAHLQHAIDIPSLGFTKSRVTRAGLERFRRVHPTCTISSDLGKFEPDYAAVPEQISPKLSPARPTGWHGWPVDAPKPAIAPFNADQARQHQEAWAKYLNVPVEYTNSIGMKFRLIPPGEFMMGSTLEQIEAGLKEAGEDKQWQECIQAEAPLHRTILTQPIYLGASEVTQGEYEKLMGTNPSYFAPTGLGKEFVAGMETTRHPVETVSWNDASEFCASLSLREKLKPVYFRAGRNITPLDGTGYRLPSEAEWEFACRAGTVTKYWIGDKDEDLAPGGWFGGNSGGRTHAVGELKANPFGLYDMHGNMWEWVQDGWDATWYHQFQDNPAMNPSRPFSDSSKRVIRGGVWGSAAPRCRSSARFAFFPSDRYRDRGFRVSLPVEAVRQALKVAEAITIPETLEDYFVRNRRAAERALAVGGDVTVEIAKPFEWRTLNPGHSLPNEPFVVRIWSIKGSTTATSDDLDVLAGLRHVQQLNLMANGRLGADIIPKLAAIRSPVKELGIGHLNLKTSTLDQLPVMSNVHLLWLSSEQVDDEWRFLRRFPGLRSIELYGAPVPNLIPLRDAPQLRYVRLTAWGELPDAATIRDIQTRHPQLRILYHAADELKVLGTDPAQVAARRLIEAGIPVEVFDSAGSRRRLPRNEVDQTVALHYIVPEIPRGMALMEELRGLLTQMNLQNLKAEGLRDTDSLAPLLSTRHDIDHLTLTDSDLTDEGLRQLQSLMGLRGLYIQGTKVSAAGVAAFHRAVPMCFIHSEAGDISVDYSATPIAESLPVAVRPSAPASDRIDFAAERQAAEWVLENKGTLSIATSPDWQWRDYGASDNAKPLPTDPFVVAILGMNNSQVKTETDLERLTRCRYLEILGISGGTLERQAIDLFTRLPRLKTLTLSDQKNLRTSALSKLGQILTLDHLAISSDMVDDRLEFVRHLPTLRTLKIWGPQPPDIDLLAEAPQLRTILLTTPDSVDDAKLAAVQARHDRLRIVVGWKGKYRIVGRDPAHEAAKQLVCLGVECFGGVNYWQAPTKLLTKADFEDGGVWSFDVRKIPASVRLSAGDREKLKLLDSYHFVAEGQREADELARSLSENHGISTITVTDCQLTDTGLAHLEKLASLRFLNVQKTKVTQAGIDRFRRAVPWCGIASDLGVFQPEFMLRGAFDTK